MDGRRHITGERGLAGLTRNLDWQIAGMGDLNGDGRYADLTRNSDWSTTGAGELPPDMINDAPVVSVIIPDKKLRIGCPVHIPLDASLAIFEDPDGDTLSYTANSSDESVVSGNVAIEISDGEEIGSVVVLWPVAVGTAVITVTATDPDGLSATVAFQVTVTTPVVTAPPQIYNDNLIVLSINELPIDSASLDVGFYARSIYKWFDDSFDYLMFFLNVPDRPEDIPFFGLYHPVSNDTQGTGQRIFFNNNYGSAGKLKGALFFPYNTALLPG